MKLIESYSNSISVDIKHKPKIYAKYFPLPINKYITIQNSSGMPAKNYSFYQECIDLMFPILQKENIAIILLGDKDAAHLNGVIDLRGKTSIAQSVYILKHSLLHFGNDSWLCHVAGSEEIPLVSLYGSTTVANHSPFHYNLDKSIFLESHRNGNKASFSRDENPKTIDFIKPEQICSSIFKLLGIEFNYSYQSLYIGNSYNNKMVQGVPNQVVNINNLGVPSLIMRMDIEFNEMFLAQQLQICPCSIVTNEPINKSLLLQFKSRILEIVYNIDKNHSVEFVRFLRDNKINYKLFSELNNEELNKIKLDYIDFNLILSRPISEPEELKNKNLDNIYYKSSLFLLSNKQIFISYHDYINNSPVPDFNPRPQKLINKNLDNFYKDKDFFIILEKKS